MRTTTTPLLVRAAMWGVNDRFTARVLTAAALACVVWTIYLGVTDGDPALYVFAALFLAATILNEYAVRWMDSHDGWDTSAG